MGGGGIPLGGGGSITRNAGAYIGYFVPSFPANSKQRP